MYPFLFTYSDMWRDVCWISLTFVRQSSIDGTMLSSKDLAMRSIALTCYLPLEFMASLNFVWYGTILFACNRSIYLSSKVADRHSIVARPLKTIRQLANLTKGIAMLLYGRLVVVKHGDWSIPYTFTFYSDSDNLSTQSFQQDSRVDGVRSHSSLIFYSIVFNTVALLSFAHTHIHTHTSPLCILHAMALYLYARHQVHVMSFEIHFQS